MRGGNGPISNYKSANVQQQNGVNNYGDQRIFKSGYQINNNKKFVEKSRFSNKPYEQNKKQVHVVHIHSDPDQIVEPENEEEVISEHESENE